MQGSSIENPDLLSVPVVYSMVTLSQTETKPGRTERKIQPDETGTVR